MKAGPVSTIALCLAACVEGSPGAAAPASTQPLAHVTAESIAAPTRFLSHDLLEGRGPGARGDQLAIEFIATELASLGLAPGMAGSYVQDVPLVRLKAEVPKTVRLDHARPMVELPRK
jgi:hypothetical protein